MSVKNWKFFYNKEDGQFVKENILDTVTLWTSIGLLWSAFHLILQETFPALDGVNTGLLVVWGLMLWAAYEWPSRYLKQWNRVLHVLILLTPILYVLTQLDKVISGAIAMAEIYLIPLNNYYDTTYELQGGEQAYIPIAYTAIFMVLWYLVWMLAYGLKRKIVLILFPVIALVVELVAGISPLKNGLFLLFVGAFLLMAIGGSFVSKKAIVAVTVVCSILFSTLWFKESISYLSSEEAKEQLEYWQDNFSLYNLLNIELLTNSKTINNDRPEHEGKVVLKLQMSQQPFSNVYLKGAHATEYKNGRWIYSDSAFKALCKENGWTENDASIKLYNHLYQVWEDDTLNSFDELVYGESGLPNPVVYTITYVDGLSNVLYTPYATHYDSFDEIYNISGDYIIKKDLFDQTVKVNGYNEATSQFTWRYLYVEEGSYRKIDWYNKVAESYLDVPEELSIISKGAQEIKEHLARYIGYVGGFGASNYFEEHWEGLSINRQREHYATAVKTYLSEQMVYSQILDELPWGADPIEYALTKGHEGYCVHFASAATLLLRELGVPARYTTGYVVSAEKLQWAPTSYYADVTDYSAHAWVEIYLENIGWVPIEMTPGYDSWGTSAQLPSEANPEIQDNFAEMKKIELFSDKEDSEAPDINQSSENNGVDAWKDFSIGIEWSGLVDVLGVLAGVTGAIALILGVLWLIKFFKQLRFRGVIDAKNTRHAVETINKQVYYMLRIRSAGKSNKLFLVGKISDEEYAEALKNIFTQVSIADWDIYMEIVKKAHYSKEEISKEEVLHCYECYKKVDEFNNLLTRIRNNKQKDR